MENYELIGIGEFCRYLIKIFREPAWYTTGKARSQIIIQFDVSLGLHVSIGFPLNLSLLHNLQ